MSLILSLIDSFLRARQMQPVRIRPTASPRRLAQQTIGKTFHKETYDFGSWSRRLNLSETQPLFNSQYETPSIDFGEGCSRRRYHAYLEPQVLPDTKSEIDFGMSGARLAPENIPRESFEQFMFGDVKRQSPQPQLTIKSSVNLRKTEKYDFGISF
jgi:hypothetical protein